MNERVANRREFLETLGAVGAAPMMAGSVATAASPAVYAGYDAIVRAIRKVYVAMGRA